MQLIDHTGGNYRFLTGIAPYSSGVIAMPGYEIVHVTLGQPLPYQQGVTVIQQHLAACRRPLQALCAVELRLPAPLSFDGFIRFNDEYRQLLADLELLPDDRNPIARTNIAPAVAAPAAPSLYGFAYTRATDTDGPSTFIVAGAGDLRDQAELAPAGIVRPDDHSDDAMREKAAVVMAVMTARLNGLGVDWPNATAVNVYTVESLRAFLVDTLLAPMGAAAGRGIHWHFSRPPIAGLAFEMDVRGVRCEEVLPWIGHG